MQKKRKQLKILLTNLKKTKRLNQKKKLKNIIVKKVN